MMWRVVSTGAPDRLAGSARSLNAPLRVMRARWPGRPPPRPPRPRRLRAASRIVIATAYGAGIAPGDDRAVPRAGRRAVAHEVLPLVDADGRCSHRLGEMERAGVVANREVAACQQTQQASEGESPRAILNRRGHQTRHRRRQHPLRIVPDEDDPRAQHAQGIADGGEVRGGPATARDGRARM